MLRIGAPDGPQQPRRLTAGRRWPPGYGPGCGGSCSADALRAVLPPDPPASRLPGSTAGRPTGPAAHIVRHIAAAASQLETRGGQNLNFPTLETSRHGRHMGPRSDSLVRNSSFAVRAADLGTAAAAHPVICVQPAQSRHLQDADNARYGAERKTRPNKLSYGLRSKLHSTCASSSCPARSARSALNSRCRKRSPLLSSISPFALLAVATVIWVV